MPTLPLAGRVAVVTGGSDGIGRGIALGMAAAGAHVAVAARRPDRIDAVCGPSNPLTAVPPTNTGTGA
jgi:NAD(P)-dependent dehydrogenase (short-subunit alcohol dehydrogenase family)